MQYRILQSIYRDEYGRLSRGEYYIEKKVSFLGFKYWKAIKHEVSDTTGCYKIATTFKTYAEAENFVREVACTNIKTTDWNKEIISYHEC